ncbi:TetR family transcriptional regulator [Hydrocarboniphaga sp.]|uniref:TetR family transcriptional regulator n=1 Tax=Hydrocarboniphaga sp. TaxID=2033016 RepID=UPI003D0CF815
MKQLRRSPAEVRHAIRHSDDSIRQLALRYGLNPKTVAKWRRRASPDDRKPGPRDPRSSALSLREEGIVVALRQHLRLPLDGCLQALRGFIPQLSRSSLHRCLQRHGISRLPASGDEAAAGSAEGLCFDLSSAQLGEKRRYQLIVAVERRSRYAFAQLYDAGAAASAVEFVAALIAAVPGRIGSLMADETIAADASFAPACADAGIRQRGLKLRQRWTGAQVERMNRTIAAAAVDGRGSVSLAQLQRQLAALLSAYNSSCELELLGGATPQQSLLRPSRTSASRAIRLRDSSPGSRPVRKRAASARKPRRSPDPASTREAILQAARRCLAHDGPEGLSLAEVARIAGVNRGTAYQHFKTRDQLIAAAAVGVSEKLFQAVFGPAGATKDRKVGSVDVAALSDRLAGFAMDNPELCRAWLLNVLSSPEPARDLFWREYRSSAERFDSTALSQDNVDTEVLSVITLAGVFLWPVWARAQYGATQDLAPLARRFAEESLRISMYGNLRPERYPEVAKRLAQRPRFHGPQKAGGA